MLGEQERKLGSALSQGLKRQVNGECAMEGNKNFLLFVPLKNFCWHLVDLRCCVSFCSTAQSESVIHIPTFLF